MPADIRRVVTAQPADGRAVKTSDGVSPVKFDFPNGLRLTEVWKSGAAPERLGTGDEEPAAGAMSLHPPAGGSVFRIAEIPPDSASDDGGSALFEQMGAADAATAGEAKGGADMHRTPTIDYGIVLSGEITLVLDDEEVVLKAGDVVVQRGANHGWANRSDAVCRMAFVMIDAVYPE